MTSSQVAKETEMKAGDIVRDRNSGAPSQWVRIIEIRGDEAQVEMLKHSGHEGERYIVWTGCLSKNAYH